MKDANLQKQDKTTTHQPKTPAGISQDPAVAGDEGKQGQDKEPENPFYLSFRELKGELMRGTKHS